MESPNTALAVDKMQWMPTEICAMRMGAKKAIPSSNNVMLSVEPDKQDIDKNNGLVLKTNPSIFGSSASIKIHKTNISNLFTKPQGRSVTVHFKQPATLLRIVFKNDVEREMFFRVMEAQKAGEASCSATKIVSNDLSQLIVVEKQKSETHTPSCKSDSAQTINISNNLENIIIPLKQETIPPRTKLFSIPAFTMPQISSPRVVIGKKPGNLLLSVDDHDSHIVSDSESVTTPYRWSFITPVKRKLNSSSFQQITRGKEKHAFTLSSPTRPKPILQTYDKRSGTSSRPTTHSDPVDWLLSDTNDEDYDCIPTLSPGWTENKKVVNSVKYKGFQNLGNTCYLNAVLQALISLDPLLNIVGHSSEHTRSLATLVQTMVQTRAYNPYKTISPSEIITYISQTTKKFGAGTQEDAHEFLLAFIDLLYEELAQDSQGYLFTENRENDQNISNQTSTTLLSITVNDDCKKQLNSIQEVFGTSLEKRVVCSQCIHVSTSHEHLRDLSVDLPFNNSGVGSLKGLSVSQLISDYFKNEQVDYKCETCDSKTAIVERRAVTTPQILVVHLKRFAYQFTAHGEVKLVKRTDRIHLDREINYGSKTAHYQLKAIVHHIGSNLQRGHYVCDVLNDISNTWRRYDDSFVSEVELTNAAISNIQQAPGTQTGYLLFYTSIS